MMTDADPDATGLRAVAELSGRDYRAFLRFAFFRYRKYHFFYLFLWVLLTGGNTWHYVEQPDAKYPWYLMLISLGVVSAGFIVIVSAVVFLVMRLLPNRTRQVMGAHRWEILPEVLRETNAMGSLETRFELLRRFETEEHVFLMRSNGVGLVLPRRAEVSNPRYFAVLRERIAAG